MTNTRQARLKNLGEVEQIVMDYIWSHGPSTSESCREALASSRPMKDSTIRTVLRRLEEKGYLTHETEGRTFIYKASDARQNVAVRAVKGIIDRFCGGSAEQLLLGMVDNAVLDSKQLERLPKERPLTERSPIRKITTRRKKSYDAYDCDSSVDKSGGSTRESGSTRADSGVRRGDRTCRVPGEDGFPAPVYVDRGALRRPCHAPARTPSAAAAGSRACRASIGEGTTR
jgi:predicted transcriptional regulator